MKLLKKLKFLEKYKGLLLAVAIFLLFCLIVITAGVIFEYRYGNFVFPGVKIDNVKLSGLSQGETNKLLKGIWIKN